MINLQYEYAKLIQEELDKNTQGLRFEVSLNNLKSDSDLQRFLRVPNTYANELKRYIPVVIETFDGDFAELENMSAAEYFANMTMLIPTDDFDVNNQVIEETFVLVSQALNEMSKRTRAKVFPLGDVCYVLPKGNSVEFDLTSVNAVNFDLEIEFTNKETQDILETLDVKLTKDAQFVKLGTNNILQDYETYKRYTFNFRREQGSYKVGVDGGEGIDTLIEDNDLGSVIKLLAEYNKIYSIKIYDEDLEKLIVADDFTILSGDGVVKWGSEGTVTLNFSLPRRLTNQMTLGEYNYQEFEVNTSGSYNDKAFVGQHIEYYLNDVRIFPVSRDEGYIGEPDNARFLGSNKGNRSVIEQTSIGKEYAVYYIPEPKVINLLEQITNESPNANTLYELKIIYPLFSREHKTVISQGGLSIVNSTPIGISFALEIADDDILT